jgi:ABC-type Na+ efflux pump permease subunit
MIIDRQPPAIKLGTVLALAGLAWALIALAFASLAPPAYVPRLFHNYHVEHMAAFYVVALLSAAALPGVRLTRIALVLVTLAAAFAAFRILALVNKVFYAEDLACDIAGVLAAIVPIYVGRFRQLSHPQP